MNPSPTSRGEGILPSQSRLEPQSRGQDALATEKRAPRVVIVGGGLAGMAAAVALEDAGVDVTLLEARRSLGGRAGSFDDPQTGEELDNCQHVLLGCCTNLIDFYRRIGAAELIRWERTIHFRDKHGRRHDLFGVPALPAPLNLGPSLLQFGALEWGEKSALIRAMLAMADLGRRGRSGLSDVSFGEWLDRHDQPASLVRKFYDPIIISGLNEDTRAASAEAAIHIFQDALLANSRGYLFGLPSCPLGRLYAKIPCRDVRVGVRVSGLDFDANGVRGVTLQTGETIDADAVVLGTNYHGVRKWIPDEIARSDARFKGLDQLQSVPILGVHLWFDRPVMRESHAALIDGPLQWLFRKEDAGTALHGVISAARDFVGRDKDELLPLFEAQVRRTLPDARDARLLRGVIVVEKRATFSPLPGVERFRPDQSPPRHGIQNLFLAGDYTKSGWPATMEGAVRSGYRAADAVLRSPSLSYAATNVAPRPYLVDDLPIQWPAKLLGLSH